MRGCSAYEGGVWFGAFIEEAGAQVGCDDAVRMMGQIHGQHVLETRAHTHTHTCCCSSSITAISSKATTTTSIVIRPSDISEFAAEFLSAENLPQKFGYPNCRPTPESTLRPQDLYSVSAKGAYTESRVNCTLCTASFLVSIP